MIPLNETHEEDFTEAFVTKRLIPTVLFLDLNVERNIRHLCKNEGGVPPTCREKPTPTERHRAAHTSLTHAHASV